jgi:pSer/pThr/pTyr-binding forkhead associated (FHA) protein
MTTEQTLTGLEFNVVQVEGTQGDKIVVDSDRVLIGSGPHCEIRLPADQVAAEHVLITFRGGAIFAQARSSQPPPMLNGSPFSETALHEGARLQIGAAEITVSIVEIADVAKAPEEKKEKVNPLTFLLAAVAIPISLFILLEEPEDLVAAGKPKDVPALWENAKPTCTQDAEAQALAVARDKRVVALGRRERSPFDIRDGVLAVPLFFLSADCYRVAGDQARATDMTRAGDKLKQQIEEGYRAHQMRLEHALDIKNLRVAQSETRTLLTMLEGKTGPYVGWLSNLDRQLKIVMGRKKKKKKKKRK